MSMMLNQTGLFSVKGFNATALMLKYTSSAGTNVRVICGTSSISGATWGVQTGDLPLWIDVYLDKTSTGTSNLWRLDSVTAGYNIILNNANGGGVSILAVIAGSTSGLSSPTFVPPVSGLYRLQIMRTSANKLQMKIYDKDNVEVFSYLSTSTAFTSTAAANFGAGQISNCAFGLAVNSTSLRVGVCSVYTERSGGRKFAWELRPNSTL